MWSNKYLNIPFKPEGREIDGLDCWGLARLVYREEFGIELPSFAGEYDIDDPKLLHEIIVQQKENWEPLNQPEAGCLVVFRMFGAESHIGIAVSPTQFLHTREKYTSAIENFSSLEWKNRIVGYFKYQENTGIVMSAIPHPLRTQRVNVLIMPGTTLDKVVDVVAREYAVSEKLVNHINLMVNGRVIPKSEWATTVLSDTDTIEYRAVPGKDAGRTLLTLALVATVMTFAGPAATALMGGSTAAAASPLLFNALSIAAGTIMMTVGGQLINAIAPIPTQDPTSQLGSPLSQNLINGGSNQLTKYATIPVVLGKMSVTPPLGAQNYSRFSGTVNSDGIVDNASVNYLDMLLVWGYGPLLIDESTLRVGKLPFSDFYGDNPDGTIRHITLDRISEPTTDQLTAFNGIYGSTIEQIQSGVNLAGNAITITANTPLNTLPANVVILDPASPTYSAQVTAAGVAGQTVANIGSTIQGLPPTVTSGDWIPSSTPGLWSNLALTHRCDKFTVALHFPQGLRATIISGDNAGQVHPAPVMLDFEIRVNNQVDGSGNPVWTHWTTQTIGGTLNSTQSVTTTSVVPATYVTTGRGGQTVVDVPEHTVTVTTQAFNITGGAYIKDAFTWTITKQRTWNVDDIVQVRVRRVTGDNPQPNAAWQYTHTVQLLSLTGYRNQSPAIDPPNSKLAKTALTIQATAQLTGSMPPINAVVQTWCPDWDSATQTWITRQTSNPASLFRYVMQHPANPQRILDSDISTKLDLAQLQYWHEYCDQSRTITLNGVTYTYKFEYNNIMGGQKGVIDVMREICAAGRASPAIVDGMWSVRIDEPRTQIVQHFSPHNSWGFQSTKGLPRLPDALRVQFIDEANDYVNSEIIVSYADKNVDTAQLFESVQLPGITNIGAAADHARWHLAQVKARPEIYELNCDIEHIVCNRGDRVKVGHDVPMWGLGSGRIKTRIAANTFALDEDLPIQLGKSYNMRVRSTNNTGASLELTLKTVFNPINVSKSGNTVTVQFSDIHPMQVGDVVKVAVTTSNINYNITSATVTATTSNSISFTTTDNVPVTGTVSAGGTVSLTDGHYSTVQIVGTTNTNDVQPGDLFLFGEYNTESVDLIVIKIEPTTNKSAKLTLVDYGVTSTYNIFTDYRTLTSDTIFQTNITLPPTLLITNFNNLTPTLPDPSLVLSDYSVMQQVSSGVYAYAIKMPFTNPANLPITADTVEAEVSLSTSQESAGTFSVKVPAQGNSITINNIEVNKEYKIRLRYVGSDGKVGLWSNFITHTVIGKSNNYQTVDSLTVVKSKRNLVITPVSNNIHSDFNCYEIRVWKNSGSGDFWTSTDATIQKFTTINSVTIDLRLFASPRIAHTGVQYRVACRALDTSGNYSPVSALTSITLFTIQP